MIEDEMVGWPPQLNGHEFEHVEDRLRGCLLLGWSEVWVGSRG